MNTEYAAPAQAHLLTKAQAAAYLGIKPRTLDDWMAAKSIAFIRRPRFVRFLQSDLDAFIQRHRMEPREVKSYRQRNRKAPAGDAAA